MERGIATLAHQSHFPTLLSLSIRSGRNPDNAGSAGGIDTSSVEAVLSSTAQQGEELEGGYYDDEDDAWCQEREGDEDIDDLEIKREDRSIVPSTSVEDFEMAIA